MAKGIKTGGRQKGTSNKLSGTVKEMVIQLVTEEFQSLPSLLRQLDPKDKVEYIIKLLPYIIPKAIPQDEIKETIEERRVTFVEKVMLSYNTK